jgi:hypothetical protein
MCFSAEADLVGAVVVGAIGVDALRHVRTRAELPLASLPALFAVHQLVEAAVWFGLQGDLGDTALRVARLSYLLIAFTVLPVLVPVAITALDPSPRRRRSAGFVALGVGVAALLTHALLRGPIGSSIDGHHIRYDVDLWHGNTVVALYVLATCGPLLASTHRHIRWFGAVNVVAVALLALIDRDALISLWCAWAAVTSAAIALHLRYAHRGPEGFAARGDHRGRDACAGAPPARGT